MKPVFLKCEAEKEPRWINRDSVVSLTISEAYDAGRPLDCYWVVALLPFGAGTALLFKGTQDGCLKYIREYFST